MAHQRHNEGAIEQVPRGDSPEPVDRRHFHRMHNAAQKEGAIEPVPLEPAPASSSSRANAEVIEQLLGPDLALQLDRAFSELDRRIGELEHKNASHLDQDATDHNGYARALDSLRSELAEVRLVQEQLATRVTAAHEKIGNALVRIEALESLDAAAKEAAAKSDKPPKTK